MRANRDSNISFLGKRGITVYPVYLTETKAWHMRIEMNGKVVKTYQKPIGETKTLTVKQMTEPWNKTLEYWRKKIEKDESDKESGGAQPSN